MKRMHRKYSQVLSVVIKTTSCAALSCHACVDETICVAVRNPTLRICGYMARKARPCGRKNPLPFPFFEAVAGLWHTPDYPKEKG